MIDRRIFFDGIRERLFHGRLSQRQVDGINFILAEWDRRFVNGDLRWLAYMLATTQWETASTMWPIEEYGKGKGRSYGEPDPVTGRTYFGRGFVQLTWKTNYQRMSGLLGVDLVNEPGMALEPRIATCILFDGMRDGLFTGVGLPDYFSAEKNDPVNARRIVNGLDRAQEIADLYRVYLSILQSASSCRKEAAE